MNSYQEHVPPPRGPLPFLIGFWQSVGSHNRCTSEPKARSFELRDPCTLSLQYSWADLIIFGPTKGSNINKYQVQQPSYKKNKSACCEFSGASLSLLPLRGSSFCNITQNKEVWWHLVISWHNLFGNGKRWQLNHSTRSWSRGNNFWIHQWLAESMQLQLALG